MGSESWKIEESEEGVSDEMDLNTNLGRPDLRLAWLVLSLSLSSEFITHSIHL